MQYMLYTIYIIFNIYVYITYKKIYIYFQTRNNVTKSVKRINLETN